MAQRVIPNTLKNAASLRFYDKGGEDLRNADEIIELCRKITTFLKREHNVSSNRTSSGGRHDRTSSSGRNGGNSNSNASGNSAPCRKHDGAHLWKDCPDNWRNPNRNNTTSGTSSSNSNSSSQNSSSRKGTRGEVKSTENQRTSENSPMVRFDDDCEADDESTCSSHASRGELMEIVGKSHSQNLHPITIITLLDSNQKRVACKALLDQCCTDRGLISWEMANMLNLPTTSSEPKVFATANGSFSSNATLKLENAMLPCLSTNRTFAIELMVIPKECSASMNYGVIIGQESMRLLDLDTSVRDNTISWGDCEVNMVPRDYWTMERIMQQKSRILKHHCSEL
jgi:hypothetical protein